MNIRGSSISPTIRNMQSRQALDRLFNMQAIKKKDGQQVCPVCQEVILMRENYNRTRVGGWTLIYTGSSGKPRLVCNRCHKLTPKPLKKKCSDGLAADRVLDKKFKSQKIKLPEKFNRKKPWDPKEKKPLPKKVKKIAYKISPADQMRIKAKEVKKKYKKPGGDDVDVCRVPTGN